MFTISYHDMNQCGIRSDALDSKVKLCYYKTYIRPLLYYGIENTPLNQKQINSVQTLESNLVKGMFQIPKKSRSTKLLRACKLEKVNELITKTKIKFAKRLLEFPNTTDLIYNLEESDLKIKFDKKSLFHEIVRIVQKTDAKFNEMILEGWKIVCECELKILKEIKTKSIVLVKEALCDRGIERRNKLIKLLDIQLSENSHSNE